MRGGEVQNLQMAIKGPVNARKKNERPESPAYSREQHTEEIRKKKNRPRRGALQKKQCPKNRVPGIVDRGEKGGDGGPAEGAIPKNQKTR